ncbi:SWM histone demethylase complex subunit phf1 [Penicillium subrubescens]|uniref:SWM histone demethylase complex subunit phf1 n=2 Tax=Penicillium subrubescens TaxID=1316194 RepID=A0A1Q5T1B5_9EURO|nr:SWM histone demethylase complex subunit phf1 [Penicillium subrubescens]
MKSSTAAKAKSSTDLASSSVNKLKKEALRDQPLAGLPTAMEKSTDHDTRTSRTGRVIKPPTAFTPPPATVASGKRKGGSRKKEANVVCIHCSRGHSPANNAIVFCDGCNNTWHQKCHDPPIDDQVIMLKDMEWHCCKCKPAPRPAAAKKSKPVKAKKAGRILHPRLQAGPRLEVGGDSFTADERRAYLSSLSHAQLVELLVHISTQNPSVPMLPANMKDLPASQFFFKPASNGTKKPETAEHITTPGSTKRTRADEDPADSDFDTNSRKRFRTTSASAKSPPKNISPEADAGPSNPPTVSTTATPDLITPSASTHPKPGPETPSTNRSQGRRLSFVSRDTTPEDSDPDTEDDLSEDAVEDHRLYPRAGNGFSPALDPENLKILDESPESHTFSHSVYDPAKSAQEMNVPPRVWQSHM